MKATGPIAVIIYLLLLGACNSPDQPLGEAPATLNASPAAADATLSAQDENSVAYYHPDWLHGQTAVRELAGQFAAESDITVEISFAMDLDAGADRALAVTNFDCFLWAPERDGNPPAENLVPLAGIDRADYDFDAAHVEKLTVDGRLTALPYQLQPLIVYFNADRLERKEYNPPASSWTMDDLLTMAAEMPLGDPVSGIFGLMVPRRDALPLHPAALLLAGRGITVFDWSGAMPLVHFSAPETIAGVTWLNELVATGVVAPYYNPEDGRRLQEAWSDDTLDDGRATFWFDYADRRDYRRDQWLARVADYSLGIAPPPASFAAWPAPAQLNFYVSAGEHLAPCLAWYDLLSSATELYTWVPARRSVREAWQAQSDDRRVELWLSVLERPSLPHPDPISRAPLDAWWEDALAMVFAGGDPAAALSRAQVKADDYLACLQGATALSSETVLACATAVAP